MAISTRYGIGYDTTFELNEFSQPRLRSEIEVIKNTILFVLFAQPGQYPSLPFIGLDIKTMLYSFYDEFSVNDLKDKIIEQCKALGACFDANIISIEKKRYKNEPSLFIYIEGKDSYPSGYMRDTIDDVDRYKIGITYDQFKDMVVSINSVGGYDE